MNERSSGLFRTAPEKIEQLIATAKDHPLGINFLLDGDLSAVAITFETHAFTVEAAREYLKKKNETANS